MAEGEHQLPRGGLVITLEQHFYIEELSDKTSSQSAHFFNIHNSREACESA